MPLLCTIGITPIELKNTSNTLKNTCKFIHKHTNGLKALWRRGVMFHSDIWDISVFYTAWNSPHFNS